MAAFPGNSPLRSVPADYHPAGEGQWYPLGEGKDRGKKLYFTDQSFGRGGAPQSLVLVPGNPECSYLFRKVLRGLLAKNLSQLRIVTLDHIGFGLSDQATRPMDPLDHAANLARLIDHLDLRRVTLVVHDWGGPIGLGAFLATPYRLRKLLILNSGIHPLPRNGLDYRNHPFPFLSWSRLSFLVPDRCWGAFASQAIASRACSRSTLIRELLRRFLAARAAAGRIDPYRMQFASRANVASSKHLARLAGHWCEIRNSQDPQLNEFYQRLRTEVPLHWGPTGTNIQARLLVGRWDPLGRVESARLWLQALPQLEDRMVGFADAGHFLPERRPAEIADSLYELLGTCDASGGVAAPPGS